MEHIGHHICLSRYLHSKTRPYSSSKFCLCVACMRVYTVMCVHAETRGGCWLSSSITFNFMLFSEKWILTESEAHRLIKTSQMLSSRDLFVPFVSEN